MSRVAAPLYEKELDEVVWEFGTGILYASIEGISNMSSQEEMQIQNSWEKLLRKSHI